MPSAYDHLLKTTFLLWQGYSGGVFRIRIPSTPKFLPNLMELPIQEFADIVTD